MSLIEQPEHGDSALPFIRMAERIERNYELQQFGGAFVVVPPANGGVPIETLILDPHQEPAQFWSILKTKCEIALAQLDDQQRAQNPFRR